VEGGGGWVTLVPALGALLVMVAIGS
jgi:hypothetical protein